MNREEFERAIINTKVIPSDGIIKIPTEEGVIQYRIDAMLNYCDHHEINYSKELTERERNYFIVKGNEPEIYRMPKKLSSLNFMECCDCGYGVLVNDLDPFAQGIACMSCQSTNLINRGMAYDVKLESLPDEEILGKEELINAVIIERYE